MWNFAVMKSMFGDYWVGKTKLETNDKSIFSTWDKATNAAIDEAAEAAALDDEDENDYLDSLEDAVEDEAEEIRPEMEKWII